MLFQQHMHYSISSGFFPPSENTTIKKGKGNEEGRERENGLSEPHIPGHGSWYQSYYLLHKALVLEEVFPQGK